MHKQSIDSKELGLQTLQKTNIESIQQTKGHLDSLIQELNLKLHDHFHKKEQELIQQYKQQLVHAQKELNQLRSNTNEEQIKNKMIERKKQLEKERHQLIQTNMFFSNKCEDYKKKLSQLVSEGKELEKELLFLDSQINNAHKKKYQVISQYEQVSSPPDRQKEITLPLFSDRKTPSQPSHKKMVNSVSVRQTNKKTIIQQSLVSKNKKNLVRQNDPISKLAKKQLQKTVLEQLFQTTVEEVRSKRKSKKEMVHLKGQEFSDYEKKLIMEEFLSKQEVKKKIYQIIFQAEDKKHFLPGSFQPEGTKVKISFQDIC